MVNWFKVKLKYFKEIEGGDKKKVSECYLYDAVSWTEAESLVFKKMEEVVGNEMFSISDLNHSNISQIYAFSSGVRWFNGIVEYDLFNDESNKVEKKREYSLIFADDITQALQRLKNELKCTVIPFEIIGVSVSKIIDIYTNELV